jgi:hypothetical protein
MIRTMLNTFNSFFAFVNSPLCCRTAAISTLLGLFATATATAFEPAWVFGSTVVAMVLLTLQRSVRNAVRVYNLSLRSIGTAIVDMLHLSFLVASPFAVSYLCDIFDTSLWKSAEDFGYLCFLYGMVWLISFALVQSFVNQYVAELQVTASFCVQFLDVAVTAITLPWWLAATLGWRSTCFLWRDAMGLLRRRVPVETRPTATVVTNEAVAVAEEATVVVGTNGFAVTIAASSTEVEATLVATNAVVTATEDVGVADITAQKPKVSRKKAKAGPKAKKATATVQPAAVPKSTKKPATKKQNAKVKADVVAVPSLRRTTRSMKAGGL